MSPTWWSPRACRPPGTAACPGCLPSPRCCCRWSLKSAPNLVLGAASKPSWLSRRLLSVSASLSCCLLLICYPGPCCSDADEYSDTARLLLCCWSSASCFPAVSTNTAASCAALVGCLGSLIGPALGHRHDSSLRSREHERRGTTDKKLPSVHTSAVCVLPWRKVTVQLYSCTTVQLYTHGYVTRLKLCSFLTFLLLLLFLSWNFNIETYIVLMMDGLQQRWENLGDY